MTDELLAKIELAFATSAYSVPFNGCAGPIDMWCVRLVVRYATSEGYAVLKCWGPGEWSAILRLSDERVTSREFYSIASAVEWFVEKGVVDAWTQNSC